MINTILQTYKTLNFANSANIKDKTHFNLNKAKIKE